LAVLDEVFLRLRAAGLMASPAKCDIAQEELLYLGHLVTRQGILPDPANVQAILQAKPPTDVTGVKSFIGMTHYYGDFVEGYAEIAAPLYELFRKSAVFDWNAERQQAFEMLKDRLASPPVLRRPDTSLPYLLHTDWSPVAIGAVLAQVGLDGQEHPIAYGSRILHGAELNYSATQGECLAVVHFLEHWRPYLYGAKFVLEVDHWALKWLMTTAHNGKLARWAMKLQEFNFEIRHRPGSQHGNADAMSRPPITPAEPAPFLAVYQKRSRFDFDSQPRVEYADSESLPSGTDGSVTDASGRMGFSGYGAELIGCAGEKAQPVVPGVRLDPPWAERGAKFMLC